MAASSSSSSKKSGSARGRSAATTATATTAEHDDSGESCPEVRVLRLDQIAKPKYDFTLHVESNVERLRERLEAGMPIPPVLVAQLGGRYYPFAAFSSLEAYRALAMDPTCQVHQAATQMNILEMHVARGQIETMHPIKYLEGVRTLHESNADMTVVPEEYRSFGTRPILLTTTARKMLDAFLQEVGEKYGLVGEWTHVIEALSRLKDDSQDRAVSEIISYVKTQKRPVPPDMFSLRRIVDAYGTDKLEKIYAEDDHGGLGLDDDGDDGEDYDDEDDGEGGGGGRKGPGRPKKGKKGKKGSAADADAAESVIVSSGSKGEMPLVMSPMPSTLSHECECGIEFMVNIKNATVRKVDTSEENMLLLVGDYGRPIYAIPKQGVEFLDLVLQPELRFYYVGGEKTDEGDRGHTMIITKRHVSKANQAAIRRIIEGGGGGGAGGSGAGAGGGAAKKGGRAKKR